MSSASENPSVQRPASPVVEICVDSLDLALAAQRGGADRIELCGPLEHGGVTPSAGLVLEARRCLDLPIAMLIRPRIGAFTATAAEFDVMRGDVRFARESGIDMVVLGILQGNGTVDVERTRELVELASSMQVTFHRAFDEAPDAMQALQDVIATGAQRILTSGAEASALDGAPRVNALRAASDHRLSMLLCGGIVPEMVEDAIRVSGVREVHAALRGSLADALLSGRAYTPADLYLFAETVAVLKSRVAAAQAAPQELVDQP